MEIALWFLRYSEKIACAYFAIAKNSTLWKKDGSNSLTASTFRMTVKSSIAKDESNIMGTAVLEKFTFEVLATVKQLGLPTYFMTLTVQSFDGMN